LHQSWLTADLRARSRELWKLFLKQDRIVLASIQGSDDRLFVLIDLLQLGRDARE